MFPSSSSRYRANTACGYAIFSGNGCAGFASHSQFPNFYYFIVCKCCKVVRFALSPLSSEYLVRMFCIFPSRAPLKIARAIVILNSISVIDLISVGVFTKKGISHKSVHFSFASNVVCAEVNNDVAVLVHQWLKDSTRRISSDLSGVRNAVKALVILSWLPDFGSAIRWVGHKLRFSKFCSSLRQRFNAFGGQLLYRTPNSVESEIA